MKSPKKQPKEPTNQLPISDREARYLVDAYYIMQDDRKRSFMQIDAAEQADEPSDHVSWLAKECSTLEREIQKRLVNYTDRHPMGVWMKEVRGIGPVLSAGLLAHIYMGEWCAVCRGHNKDDCKERQKNKRVKKKGTKVPPHKYQPVESCPTVGHIYQFAGIAGDGQREWKAKTKRPYNAQLKVLTWKIGQSFMKAGGYYGDEYRRYKAIKQQQNDSGGYKARSADLVKNATVNYRATESYKHNQKGVLSPGHIDGMARRYATKLFLAHMHDTWYRMVFKKAPPLPYPIAHMGHAHVLPPPHAAE